MKNIALFWDFDGTLIHANQSFFDSLRHAFQKYQIVIADETVREFLRQTSTWYRPDEIYPERTHEAWWEDYFEKLRDFLFAHNVDATIHNAIFQEFRMYLLNPDHYVLYPDAVCVLAELKAQGYQNYILSNNFPELPELIARYGLDLYLEDYVLSSCIGYEKPRQEIFEYARELAQYPDSIYMIGDNPVADIYGAKTAGFRTILVHSNSKTEYADDICAHLTDIPAVLQKHIKINEL